MFSPKSYRRIPFVPVAVFLLLALGTGIAGFTYYRHVAHSFKTHMSEELAAIADLKVRQVDTWRRERMADAMAVSRNTLAADKIEEFFKNPSEEGLREKVLAWLSSFLAMNEYSEAFLCDADKTPRLWVGPSGGILYEEYQSLPDEVVGKGEARLIDFHRSDKDSPIHLALLVPLPHPGQENSPGIGALVLLIDPTQFIYPAIQTWPAPSDSAETLLVRREGEEVLFLNELRHVKDTALTLRKPLGRESLPAAMAVRGEEGVVEGVDYRGAPVLAALRRVPGSPWFMVAKVDTEEIYAPLRAQQLLVAAIVGSMILMAGFALTLVWQRRQTFFDRREREAANEQKLLGERFDYLSRYANDIIFLIGPDGRIVEANDRALQAYGYSREDMLARNIRDLRAPETLALLDQQMKQVSEQNGFRFETVHVRREGTKFPVEVSSRLIEIEDERYFQSIIRDITERSEAERKITRLNRLYAVLSQTNQAIVRLRDRQDLLWEVCRVATTYGKFPVAWIGILDHEEGRLKPAAWSGIEGMSLSGMPISEACAEKGSLTAEGALQEDACIICNDVDHDPRSIPGLNEARKQGCSSFALIPIRPRGELMGALWVCAGESGSFDEEEAQLLEEIGMDLSFAMESLDLEVQRSKALEELKAGEAKFRSLFQEFNALLDAIPDGLTLQDENLTTIWANRGAARALGTDVFGLVGRDCCETWHGKPKFYEACPVVKCLKTGLPEEEVITSPDGRVWDLRTVPVKDDSGKVSKVVQLARDITEHRRMEAQLNQAQKMEAIGTLSGGIAHDFNNILGAIMGYTELALLYSRGDSALREKLQQVLDAADRAKDLVKQILAFSRQSEQERKPVQIGIIVKEALKLLRASLPTTIEMRQNITSHETVLADSTQIHQVLMNLCTNAAHAMREKGGVLEVRLTDVALHPHKVSPALDSKDGKYVKLVVRDTGHCIDPAVMDKIFDPFFTTKKQGEGTGLGLSVVHGIVKSHGGSVEVESRPGEGTAFSVLLPVVQKPHAPEAEPIKPLPVGSERILFVDDEPALSKIGKQMLEHLGYRVVARTSSIEALEVFRSRTPEAPFDMVITDMTMPHMTGAELARELLRLDPQVRIILCTGFSEKIASEEARAMGIRGFLMKPVVLKDLAESVRNVLDENSGTENVRS